MWCIYQLATDWNVVNSNLKPSQFVLCLGKTLYVASLHQHVGSSGSGVSRGGALGAEAPRTRGPRKKKKRRKKRKKEREGEREGKKGSQ